MVSRIDTAMALPSAALVDALSRAFAYPMSGLDATLEALRALDEADWISCGAQVEEVFATCGQLGDLTAEQLAYTRLFIGSLKMEAPPYASFYLEESHTLNGRAAVEVAAVYRLFGLELDDEENAPADHLRYLLAFMALLLGRYESSGEDAFAEAYEDFRDEYVLTWIDECASLVERCAENPYYPALMRLIVAVMKGEGNVRGTLGAG